MNKQFLLFVLLLTSRTFFISLAAMDKPSEPDDDTKSSASITRSSTAQPSVASSSKRGALNNSRNSRRDRLNSTNPLRQRQQFNSTKSLGQAPQFDARKIMLLLDKNNFSEAENKLKQYDSASRRKHINNPFETPFGERQPLLQSIAEELSALGTNFEGDQDEINILLQKLDILLRYDADPTHQNTTMSRSAFVEAKIDFWLRYFDEGESPAIAYALMHLSTSQATSGLEFKTIASDEEIEAINKNIPGGFDFFSNKALTPEELEQLRDIASKEKINWGAFKAIERMSAWVERHNAVVPAEAFAAVCPATGGAGAAVDDDADC